MLCAALSGWRALMEFGKCQSVMVGTFQLVRQNLTSTSTTPQILRFVEEERQSGSLAIACQFCRRIIANLERQKWLY